MRTEHPIQGNGSTISSPKQFPETKLIIASSIFKSSTVRSRVPINK